MLDPVYDAVLTELRGAPPLPILDIGCGPGLLAAVLRTGGLTAPIHGLDYDPRKTDAAREAVGACPGARSPPATPGRACRRTPAT